MSELTEAPRVGRTDGHRMESGFLKELLVEHVIGNAMGLIDEVDQDVMGSPRSFTWAHLAAD